MLVPQWMLAVGLALAFAAMSLFGPLSPCRARRRRTWAAVAALTVVASIALFSTSLLDASQRVRIDDPWIHASPLLALAIVGVVLPESLRDRRVGLGFLAIGVSGVTIVFYAIRVSRGPLGYAAAVFGTYFICGVLVLLAVAFGARPIDRRGFAVDPSQPT